MNSFLSINHNSSMWSVKYQLWNKTEKLIIQNTSDCICGKYSRLRFMFWVKIIRSSRKHCKMICFALCTLLCVVFVTYVIVAYTFLKYPSLVPKFISGRKNWKHENKRCYCLKDPQHWLHVSDLPYTNILYKSPIVTFR